MVCQKILRLCLKQLASVFSLSDEGAALLEGTARKVWLCFLTLRQNHPEHKCFAERLRLSRITLMCIGIFALRVADLAVFPIITVLRSLVSGKFSLSIEDPEIQKDLQSLPTCVSKCLRFSLLSSVSFWQSKVFILKQLLGHYFQFSPVLIGSIRAYILQLSSTVGIRCLEDFWLLYKRTFSLVKEKWDNFYGNHFHYDPSLPLVSTFLFVFRVFCDPLQTSDTSEELSDDEADSLAYISFCRSALGKKRFASLLEKLEFLQAEWRPLFNARNQELCLIDHFSLDVQTCKCTAGYVWTPIRKSLWAPFTKMVSYLAQYCGYEEKWVLMRAIEIERLLLPNCKSTHNKKKA